MNGIINLLVNKDDPIAILLRRQFVFKLIPMLNPDGVARGHYRTDTRGCNLNRYYLNPSWEYHPSIFGARSVIQYHHYGEEIIDNFKLEKFDASSQVDPNEIISESDPSSPDIESPRVVELESIYKVEMPGNDSEKSECNYSTCQDNNNSTFTTQNISKSSTDTSIKNIPIKRSNESMIEKELVVTTRSSDVDVASASKDESKKFKIHSESVDKCRSSKSSLEKKNNRESGLFLYLDMHGHASKKGVFIYGNHFDKIEDSVECMLFPKLMSVNSQNFHFSACNFTEKNMYLR